MLKQYISLILTACENLSIMLFCEIMVQYQITAIKFLYFLYEVLIEYLKTTHYPLKPENELKIVKLYFAR